MRQAKPEASVTAEAVLTVPPGPSPASATRPRPAIQVPRTRRIAESTAAPAAADPVSNRTAPGPLPAAPAAAAQPVTPAHVAGITPHTRRQGALGERLIMRACHGGSSRYR